MCFLSSSQLRLIDNVCIGNGLQGYRSNFLLYLSESQRSADAQTMAQLYLKVAQKAISAHEKRMYYENAMLMSNSVPLNLVSDLFAAVAKLPLSQLLYIDEDKAKGMVHNGLLRAQCQLDFGVLDPHAVALLLENIICETSDVEIWSSVLNIVRNIPDICRRPTTWASKIFHTTFKGFDDCYHVIRETLSVKIFHGVKIVESMSLTIPHLEHVFPAVFNELQQDGLYLNEFSHWARWCASGRNDDTLSFLQDILIRIYVHSRELLRGQYEAPNCLKSGYLINGKSSSRSKIGLFDLQINPLGGCGIAEYRWNDALVVGLILPNDSDDGTNSTYLEILQLTEDVWQYHDRRRFFHTFTICGSLMRVYYIDRQGICCSDSFDINGEARKLVLYLAGLVLMDEAKLGLDTSIICCSEYKQNYLNMQKPGTERIVRFRIEDIISDCAPNLFGNGTTCWIGVVEEDENELIPTKYVIKDCWSRDQTESNILKITSSHGVRNVVKCVCDEVVHINGNTDSTDCGRSVFNKGTPSEIVLYADKQDTNEKMKWHQRQSDSIDDKTVVIWYPVSDHEKGDIETDGRLDSDNHPRIHCRLLLNQAGVNLCYVDDLVKLLKSLLGAVDGLESLYTKVNIIYRDISWHNIMYDEHTQSGYLIDFDTCLTKDQCRQQWSKAGTRLFMSVNVGMDDDHIHSFMDDLESIFWVLLAICLYFEGPYGIERQSKGRNSGHRLLDYFSSSSKKMKLVGDRKVFKDFLYLNVKPYFFSVIGCLLELRDVFFKYGKPWQVENELVYHRVREILKGGLKHRIVKKTAEFKYKNVRYIWVANMRICFQV